MSGVLRPVFKLAFELSPIVLVNGIAEAIPGGMLPIIAITEAAHLLTGILGIADNINLDNFFAHYRPLPGSTLISNIIGEYPFANQSVAANAIIQMPLDLSMLMVCPARDELGYATKLITTLALKKVLDLHIQKGGTFTVITPSYFYTNGVLLRMTDASDQRSWQAQNAWQLDFHFPLLTVEAAEGLQNSLMQKFTNGTQVGSDPSWSGLQPSVGTPDSLATPGLAPIATNLPGAGTAPFSGTVGALG